MHEIALEKLKKKKPDSILVFSRVKNKARRDRYERETLLRILYVLFEFWIWVCYIAKKWQLKNLNIHLLSQRIEIIDISKYWETSEKIAGKCKKVWSWRKGLKYKSIRVWLNL